jgi:hypothetical protein
VPYIDIFMFLLKHFEDIVLEENDKISTAKKSPFLALGTGHYVKKAGT